MTPPLGLRYCPDTYGWLQSKSSAMGASTNRGDAACGMKGPWVVNHCQGDEMQESYLFCLTPTSEEARTKFVPAAAVIRTVRTLFGITGLTGCVGGLSSGVARIPRLQPGNGAPKLAS